MGWQRLVCPQSVGLICNRGLQKQGYSIEGNSQFREPDNRCHPIGLSHDLPLPFPRPHVVFHIPTSGHAKQSLLFRHAAAPASPFLDMRSHTIQFSKNLRFFWLLSSDPTPRLRLFPPPLPIFLVFGLSQGMPSEHWLLPEQHRKFLSPDPKVAELHRRSVVVTMSSRAPNTTTTTTRTTSSPSPSPSPITTRGPSPSILPPITTNAASAAYPRWPQQSPGPSSGKCTVSLLPGAPGQLGAPGAGPASAVQNAPKHESCTLHFGQVPDENADSLLRRLFGYFWFSVY